MKNLVLILILSVSLIACKKENLAPGNYHQTTQTQDTSSWQSNYGNGGTLPNWGNGNNTNNQLFGTNWVLTDVYNNYAIPIRVIQYILLAILNTLLGLTQQNTLITFTLQLVIGL